MLAAPSRSFVKDKEKRTKMIAAALTFVTFRYLARSASSPLPSGDDVLVVSVSHLLLHSLLLSANGRRGEGPALRKPPDFGKTKVHHVCDWWVSKIERFWGTWFSLINFVSSLCCTNGRTCQCGKGPSVFFHQSAIAPVSYKWTTSPMG